jgi:hypothetical protein
MTLKHNWNNEVVHQRNVFTDEAKHIADGTCQDADTGHAHAAIYCATHVNNIYTRMANLLREIARVVCLVLVFLYLAIVGKCCICETTDVKAIMNILCPQNISTESTSHGRNFIDAPARCPPGERQDPHGNCKEIY